MAAENKSPSTTPEPATVSAIHHFVMTKPF
jgi:hypothetical protein